VAGAEPALSRSLHAHFGIVAQYDRTFLPRPDAKSAAARSLPRLEQLIMGIGDYIDKHNLNPKPFIWTAKASDILEKVTRARTTSIIDDLDETHH